jgi:hypothetical protein
MGLVTCIVSLRFVKYLHSTRFALQFIKKEPDEPTHDLYVRNLHGYRIYLIRVQVARIGILAHMLDIGMVNMPTVSTLIGYIYIYILTTTFLTSSFTPVVTVGRCYRFSIVSNVLG